MEDKLTFESALERLESIADQLEDGNLSLEESLKLYEEGAKLAGFCTSSLKSAEQKITELSGSEDNGDE